MARKTGIDALHSRRLAAVDVFSKAANDLLTVAADYRALADAALSEAERHAVVATDASQNATLAEEQAAKVRALLG